MEAIVFILIAVLFAAGFFVGGLVVVSILVAIDRAGTKPRKAKKHKDQRPSYQFDKKPARKPEPSKAETEKVETELDSDPEPVIKDEAEPHTQSRLKKLAENPHKSFIENVSTDEDAEKRFTQHFRHRQNASYNYARNLKNNPDYEYTNAGNSKNIKKEGL